MSNRNQSSNQIANRSWTALWFVLLLAPLSMAPKGCSPIVVGDECPGETTCTAGAAGNGSAASAGTAGEKPTGSAGSAGSTPTGSAGSAGSTPTGSAGSTGNNPCGGVLGLTCAADEYCAFDEKAACGAADQTGVCTAKPQVCEDIYVGVCGCDGQTYANECQAATKGTSLLHTGACDVPSSGTSCGGLKPVACAKSEYCDYPSETKCGSGDQTGTCTTIPEVCDALYDPVCGCDAATYANACAAAMKGISVLHSGSCDGSMPGSVCSELQGQGCPNGANCIYPIEAECGSNGQTGTCGGLDSASVCPQLAAPVCGCDGATYDNACLAKVAGQSVAKVGACQAPGVACGAQLGNNCGAGQYCNYPLSALCGAADGTGTCTLIPEGGCTANYDPVCGCDGKTYGNSCEASIAGMAIGATGACP